MNHNAYRNTRLAYWGVHNWDISRVAMLVREQLKRVEMLSLGRYLLFLLSESHFQVLLPDRWHTDIDTQDFFGVQ